MEKEVIEALKLVIKAKDELIIQLREEISRLKSSSTININPSPIGITSPPQHWPWSPTWITTSGTTSANIPFTTTGFVSTEPTAATVLEMNQTQNKKE